MKQPPRPRRILPTLFVVAIIARLPLLIGLMADPHRAVVDDSKRYIMLADNLRMHGTFGLAEEEHPWVGFRELREQLGTAPARDANGLIPEGLRTPGFPLFLAAVRTVSHSPLAIVFAQILLSGATACLIASAAFAFSGSRRGAWTAGLLWALHPALIAMDAAVLSESVFTFGVALAFWFAARVQSGRMFLVAALIVGLWALVRPFGVFLVLPLAFAAFARADRRWWTTLGVCVLTALPSVAWSARNLAKGEGFRLCTVGDLTMYYYFAHAVRSEPLGTDWHATWSAAFPKRTDELREHAKPGDDCHALAGRLAREELAADPKSTAKVLLKSQLKLWTGHSLADVLRTFGIAYKPSGLMSTFVFGEESDTGFSGWTLVAAAWSLFNLAIFAWALIAAVKSLRRRMWVLFLSCVSVAALSAAGTMCNGQERFRLPILVPMIVLIGSTRGPRLNPNP